MTTPTQHLASLRDQLAQKVNGQQESLVSVPGTAQVEPQPLVAPPTNVVGVTTNVPDTQQVQEEEPAPTISPALESFFEDEPEGDADAQQTTAPTQTAGPAQQAAPQSAENTEVDMKALELLRLRELDDARRALDATREALELKAQVGETPTEEPFDFDPDVAAAMTEDERKAFQNAAPMFQRMFQHAMKRYHNAHVAPVHKSVQQVGNVDDRIGKAVFDQQVAAAFPEMPEISKTAGWKQFLEQSVPYTAGRKKIGHLIQESVNNRDIEALKEIVSGYNPTNTSERATASPGQAQVSTPNTRTPVRKFSRAKYAEALERVNKREMSWAEFVPVQQAYFQALATGMVADT